MARTTGPILLVGVITVTNQVIFQKRDIDWRVPIAAGAAAGLFAFLEKGIGDVAVALAYATLVSSLFVSVPGDVDPPITAAVKWFNQK